MKVRNKKTGEIGTLDVPFPEEDVTDEGLIVDKDGGVIGRFSSIAELYDEWEDYEEKRYWIIDTMNDSIEDYNVPMDATFNKEIGNYFETKEEAEKVVEKLKAWKRLKDRGFIFTGYNACSVDYDIDEQYRKYISQDLDLLFGGEE